MKSEVNGEMASKGTRLPKCAGSVYRACIFAVDMTLSVLYHYRGFHTKDDLQLDCR